MFLNKKLKKIYFILFSIFLFTSCSSLQSATGTAMPHIRTEYEKHNIRLNLAMAGPISNKEIESIKKDFQSLLVNIENVKAIVSNDPTHLISLGISSDELNSYEEKTKRKIIICNDLKD